MNGSGPSLVDRIKKPVVTPFRAARRRWHWLDHAVLAWKKYKSDRGDHLAAAVTFFSFLSLFPLILLGVSVAGFVLKARPDLEDKLFEAISDNVPGDLGDTISSSVQTAIDARAGVGLIGLGAVLLTGLGWVANLRTAVEAVWGQPPSSRNFFTAKIADLVVLAGLGLGVVISLGLTVVGAQLTPQVIDALDLGGVAGISVVTKVASILIAIVGDMLVLGWMMVRLPKATLPWSVSLRGTLLAAVGFEALKLIATLYIARVTHSPTAGIFASVIGILVWLNLLCRFQLYCVAWLATAIEQPTADPADAGAADRSGVASGQEGASPAGGAGVPSAVTVAALVGAGAVLGAGAAVGAHRWRRRSGEDR